MRCDWLVAFATLIALAATSASIDPAFAEDPDPIRFEVIGNIQNQPVGRHTARDFHLPMAYVERVADRVIRESFEARFRIVVPDAAGSPTTAAVATRPATDPRDHSPATPGTDGPRIPPSTGLSPRVELVTDEPIVGPGFYALGALAVTLLLIGIFVVVRGGKA